MFKGFAMLTILTTSPQWYAAPEWWLCVLGVPTLVFIALQAQATARAAKATEKSVQSGREASQRQLRAYLAVTIGEATYQESEKNLRFEARPILINSGQTPAHKIKFNVRAAILAIPLRRETDLPETGDVGTGETVLGVQQTGSMNAVVDGFSQENEVDGIKSGISGKGLYVWGLVSYEDVFGDSHSTRFCQQLFWDNQGKVRGFYIAGRNDAT